MGYVPDCDGDRGNVVVYDEQTHRAMIIGAQEVFSVCVIAELAHLQWSGKIDVDKNGNPLTKCAVVVNDPTSLMVNEICSCFGVEIHSSEVGEANVVGLAKKLRDQVFHFIFLFHFIS